MNDIDSSRRRRRLGITAGLLATVAVWATVGGGGTAVAFDHPWSPVAANSNARCDLWDDSPGTGPANETGFFWVVNVVAGEEYCTFRSDLPALLPSSTYGYVQVKVAVNDSARFTVRVLNAANMVISTIVVQAPDDHSGFLSRTAAIPPGHSIRAVSVSLDDNPNPAVGSGRSSALIDNIRIFSYSGATGWNESFSRAA